MKLGLNLATHRPPSAEARRLAATAVVVALVLFCATAMLAWRAHRRLHEERTILAGLAVPPEVETVPDSTVDAYAQLVAAPRPPFTESFLSLERKLPREVGLERIDWTGDALVVAADVPNEDSLGAAETAALEAARLKLVSTAAQDDRIVAVFRGAPSAGAEAPPDGGRP